MNQPDSITLTSGDPAEIIFLDAEMTTNDRDGELLELSVVDVNGRVLFNHLFRPATVRWWRTDIHHITRGMVRHERPVAHYRRQLNEILSRARYVVGCGLHNDLFHLEKAGLTPVPPGKQIELQRWYWLLHDSSSRTDYQETALSRIADTYGLSVSDTDAHRSLYDTRLTLAAFHALAADTVSRGIAAPGASPADVTASFLSAHDVAHREYWRHHARGWMELRPAFHGTYSAIFRATPPDPEVAAADPSRIFVPLSDRFSAQWQLSQQFHSRPLKTCIELSRITPAQARRLASFDVPFDYESSLHAHAALRDLRIRHQLARRLNTSPDSHAHAG